MLDHNEQRQQLKYAEDPNRAAFFWSVQRNGVILLQEYEPDGTLHRLAEILVPPPYEWHAISYRSTHGILAHRKIDILPGYAPVWEKRAVSGISAFHDMGQAELLISEDCLIFGRRKLDDTDAAIMLIYPDGEQFGFSSLVDARQHKR